MIGRKRQGGWGWKGSKDPKRSKTVAAKVSRLQRQVALLKPEVKRFSSTLSQANISQAGGFIQCLSLQVQGSDDVNRIGDSIRGVYIRVVGLLSQFSNLTKVYVVKDKESNGTTPVIAATSNSIFNSFNPRNAILNHERRNRFSVLYERAITSASATYGFAKDPYFDTGEMKISGLTTFIGTAGTTADSGKNQYYIVVLCDGADTTDLNGTAEMGFTDV